MGHRVGKTFYLGCIRQSAVRSSVNKRSPVNVNGHHNLYATRRQSDKQSLSTPHQITNRRKLSTAQFIMSVHLKARSEIYPRTKDVKRCPVPDDNVPWCVEFIDYEPVDFTSQTVSNGPEWADPKNPSDIKFNCIDASCNVDRRSYEGEYKVVNGYPRNPKGRTGCTGRGSLGRWGPNHAADPIVTRWKRDENTDEIMLADDGKPILQFVSVQRRDCGEWALPGGMVNPGENRTASLIREFGEEALNSLEATDEDKIKINTVMMEFFKNGYTIYKGYVDDPRNTDNAWMETKAMNFHDEDGSGVGRFKLHAGDDAAAVQWMDIDSSLKLYASHIDFIRATVDHQKAHWGNKEPFSQQEEES